MLPTIHRYAVNKHALHVCLCVCALSCHIVSTPVLSHQILSTPIYAFLTEEDYEKLPASTVPEMQRTNLAPVILQLKALGIDNVLRFSFLSVREPALHPKRGWDVPCES